MSRVSVQDLTSIAYYIGSSVANLEAAFQAVYPLIEDDQHLRIVPDGKHFRVVLSFKGGQEVPVDHILKGIHVLTSTVEVMFRNATPAFNCSVAEGEPKLSIENGSVVLSVKILRKVVDKTYEEYLKSIEKGFEMWDPAPGGLRRGELPPHITRRSFRDNNDITFIRPKMDATSGRYEAHIRFVPRTGADIQDYELRSSSSSSSRSGRVSPPEINMREIARAAQDQRTEIQVSSCLHEADTEVAGQFPSRMWVPDDELRPLVRRLAKRECQVCREAAHNAVNEYLGQAYREPEFSSTVIKLTRVR